MRTKLFTLALLVAAFAAPPALAQAESETSVSKEDFVFDVFTCEDDFVTVRGTIHTVSHITFDDSGGAHFVIGTTVSGAVGSDAGGETFHFSETDRFVSNFTSGGATTDTSNFHQISTTRGPRNNVYLKRTIHITTNANGEVTAVVANIEFECR